MDLNEQVVLITGSSRGLGAATAKVFGREGAKVVVNYVNSKEKAEQVVAEIGKENAIAIQADVSKYEEVERLFAEAKEHFNQAISTIVNNALIGFSFNGDDRSKLDEIKWDEFQTQLQG